MGTIWKITVAAMLTLGVAACSDADQLTEPGAAPEFSRASGDGGQAGAVYLSTNSPAGNEVLVYPRGSDGSLAAPSAFATGGLGTGGGLGNQNAVVLSHDGRRLFVVNAGSDEVSVFAVRSSGLELLDRAGSGGTRPVSVAVRGRLVYVLNAGGTGNIAGFELGHRDRLQPIANSTRPLSSPAAGAAQVSFSPDGDLLVVTEKATNNISVYRVGRDGRAAGPRVQPSVGATPFGFAFSNAGILVVSEAFGGAPDASALSSYRVRGGALHAVSPSAATTETAACWVVITTNGRFAYTSNTGSGTITGYRLDADGKLSILNADGVTATTGAGPIDLALSRNSRFFYSLNSGSGTIGAFSVQADGALSSLGSTPGLPAGANGLAAQ